jgi:hypothetical protein
MRKAAQILMSLLVCSCTGCKKTSSLPAAGGTTLAKIVSIGQGGSPFETEMFSYDAQNRLIKIFYLDSTGNLIPNYGQTFTYDSTGKCSGSTTIQYPFWPPYPIDTLTFSFTYDMNEHIVQVIKNATTQSQSGSDKLTYNADGLLIADSSFNSSGEIMYYLTYTYDAYVNVVSTETFTWYQGSFVDLVGGPTNFYYYDHHVNPYYKIGKLLFAASESTNFQYLSKENIIKTTTFGSPAIDAIYSSYTYFDNGLVRTANFNGSNYGTSFYYIAP